MASKSFIDLAGLQHYDEKLRQDLANPKHSYTTAANAAKGYYRIANAVASQINGTTSLHLQFLMHARSEASGVGYWQTWFVDLEVSGQNAGLRIFGNSTMPFNYCRVLYENTAASVTSSTRPAVDINLNYVLASGTVIEIEEIHNSGFEFVANGQLAASTVPSGYENKAISINSNGVQYASNASYADRSQIQRSDISSNITLADNDTYRCRALNCTGSITVTVPSLNSGWCWFIIKNNNAAIGNITIHPSTTSVMIDGSNDDIILRPKESILLLSRAANSYVILHDARRRTALVGCAGEIGSQTKHWFLVGETTETGTYRDVYLEAKVFIGSGTTLYGGVLSAHVRVDGTKGVASNKQLHWQWKNDGINPEDFVLTTVDTSGTSTKIQLWWKGAYSYSSLKFVVTAEHSMGDELDVHKWKLTRARKTEGDLENFDTGFTSVTTSSVLPLSNNITGTAANVTGTVAIANGGTGATTRLDAIKALTNEKVGTDATDFITAKTGWAKCGYTSVADAKTVLGLKSAAYTESSAYATAGHTHSYLPLTGGTLTGELNVSSANALRMKSSDYGAFFRNDNSYLYLMVTASGDADGTWTTARPLTVNLASGVCNINGSAATATSAGKVSTTVAVDTTGELVKATMGSNDAFRIAVGGASNAGWAEIATADDYSEPIYVRQYQGGFATLKREAKLLDGSGNTSFPGTVTASVFTGNVTGNCSGSSGSAQRYIGAGNYADIVQTFQSDNENYRSCTIRCTNGDGFNEIVLGAHNESNAAPSGIAVRNTNGTLTATAPTPASATDSSTNIATTAWVRNATGNTNLNAATATKATQDGSGNNIINTYATKTELENLATVTNAQIDTLFA